MGFLIKQSENELSLHQQKTCYNHWATYSTVWLVSLALFIEGYFWT